MFWRLSNKNLNDISVKEQQTTTSLLNIQAKIVEMEAEYLRLDKRNKQQEIDLKIAKNTEINTRDALHREIKIFLIVKCSKLKNGSLIL